MLRLLIAALLLVASPAAAEISAAARAAWGFDRSDLQPHPAVLFGVLANGMRYAVMRSETGGGALAVRLRIGAGAAAEHEGERGAMHLLEHMVFEGSRNIPDRTLPRWLARRGLAAWEDFSAFTDYHQTVYRLDLPVSDAAAVETGLHLMRETASELSLTAAGLRRARPMVLAEIAARDPMQDAIAAAQNAFFMPGTAIARGPVAAHPAAVASLDLATLRRLYARFYVPEQAILVIVGDLDPQAVEARIAHHFASWRQRSSGPLPAEAPIDPRRTSATHVFIDPDAPTSVTIAAAAPLGGIADAAAPRDRLFLQHLGCEMLSRRLTAIAATEGAAIAGGDCAIYDHFRTGRLARVELAARNRDWAAALRSGRAALQEAIDRGFSQAELDAQLGASIRALEQRNAPRTSAALADAIVDAAAGGTIFTIPQDRAAAQAYLTRIRLEYVNAAFAAAWREVPGRLIFISHHEPVPEAAAALASARE